jgi:uncharacterized membrane protein
MGGMKKIEVKSKPKKLVKKITPTVAKSVKKVRNNPAKKVIKASTEKVAKKESDNSKIEEKKSKSHERVQTAEGWKRTLIRRNGGKKVLKK